MAKVFRWLVRIFVGATFVAGLAIALVYYLASRSLPDYNAEHAVKGLASELEIIRDNANVPHIFGQTDVDNYFGLGYVHAQDRLWQMLMFRMTAQGNLSEVFGERTFEIDRLMRRFDFNNLAAASVSAQDEYGLAALEAYARGVNARISRINEGALGRGAPELFVFPTAIAPWTPADSLAVTKLMSLQLATHLQEEVRRARASLVLEPARLADLLAEAPGPGVVALPEFASLWDGFTPLDQTYDPEMFAKLSPVVPNAGLSNASNAWAAAPNRSAKQGTLLAVDPHMSLGAPGTFYLARMQLYSGPLIGGTIPGIPAIIMGRSDKFGWGLTSSYLDDQDVFIEKINPENPDEYLTPGGWKSFEERQTIIRIKDQAPRTITLRWTDNGPVLPDGTWGLNTVTPEGHVPAVSWTALSGQDGTMSALLRLMQSSSISEAIENGEGIIAPSNNMIMADENGVGMVLLGAIPKRPARHQSLGQIPSPGWLATNRWQGRQNYAANPKFVELEGGMIGNTNNKIADKPFPFHLSHSWGDTQRIQRLRRLMQNREVHTRESFVEAQLDSVSVTARTLLPLVGRDLFFTEDAGPANSTQGRRKMALDLLAGWNGDMNEHRPEPLIFSAWMRVLQARLISDDLADVREDFKRLRPLFIERVYRDIDGASAWCDVHQSAAIETCTSVARAALDEALLWIDQTYGGRLESLRWGDAHETRADHQTLGSIPGLSWIVNIRQSTSGGDNTLLRGATNGTDAEPFTNVHGSVFRAVYDFADPDSSVFVTSTGQSGHPLSRYYDDMTAFWRRGEYVPMTLDPTLARAASVGTTRLYPE